MRTTLLAVLALCAPFCARADVFVADAFGLYQPGQGTEMRARWADTDRVQAGPVTSVLFFAGPKTMVAGTDQGHLVALSFDADGNLAGQAARFVFHDGLESVAVVRHGLSGHLFSAGRVAGDFLAAARVDGRQSQRADYSVTADLASLTPRVQAPDVPIPPDTALDLGLAPMVDRFGNPVPDGIALGLGLTDAAGRYGQATALSLGGAASLPLILRDVTGTVQAVPMIGRATGPATALAMAEPVAQGSLQVAAQALPEIDAVSVVIGPIETSLGYLLPDGTLVEMTVRGASGAEQNAQGWVLAGHVTGMLPLSPDDLPITVTLRSALGTQSATVTTLSQIAPRGAME